jgi:carboxyl-terminal processing protease
MRLHSCRFDSGSGYILRLSLRKESFFFNFDPLFNLIILKNKITLYLPILFALVLIAGILIGNWLTPVSTIKHANFHGNRYDKLSDMVNYIVQEYVDTVDRNSLTEDGINGILQDLDPHSQYITAEEFHDVNDPLLGNFEGIGIQFRIEKDTIIVIQTIPGGPSERLGLVSGDRIVKIDDTLVAGVKFSDTDAMKKLKGKRGTKVKVSIFRRGLTNLLDFMITRDIIPTYSIDVAFMPSESVGYIKLSKFSATTFDEFKKAVSDLKEKGMNKLILDLRDNTGGYLQAAIDVSDELLQKDKLIVYTEGKSQPRESFYATSKGSLEDNDVVILIDEGSASASEIVAGAIQDNDRGEIMGRRSFGKGLVQRQLDFPDGSALRLTVARYFTPTGRCIQRPYIKGNGFEEYYAEHYNRFANGELEEQDSIHFNDSLKYITPGGKVLYGGGGIMPDVFIPVEKDTLLIYYNKLVQSGLIFRFAFEQTDKHRKEFQQYDGFDDFDKQFVVSDVLLNELVAYAEKNGVEKDKEGLQYAKAKISTLLKAFISRNIYDDKGFYPIFLSIDKTFIEASTFLNNNNN